MAGFTELFSSFMVLYLAVNSFKLGTCIFNYYCQNRREQFPHICGPKTGIPFFEHKLA